MMMPARYEEMTRDRTPKKWTYVRMYVCRVSLLLLPAEIRTKETNFVLVRLRNIMRDLKTEGGKLKGRHRSTDRETHIDICIIRDRDTVWERNRPEAQLQPALDWLGWVRRHRPKPREVRETQC